MSSLELLTLFTPVLVVALQSSLKKRSDGRFLLGAICSHLLSCRMVGNGWIYYLQRFVFSYMCKSRRNSPFKLDKAYRDLELKYFVLDWSEPKCNREKTISFF